MANAILASARKPLIASVAGAALGLLAFALIPPRYAASTQLTITSERQGNAAARLAGFAAQLGIGAALAGSGDSPELFTSIAKSRDVARLVLADTVCLEALPCSSVRRLLQLPTDTGRRADDKQLKELQRRLSVSIDPRLSVITVSTWGPSPAAAEGLLRAQLRAFSEQVIARRESQAHNERVFAEQRLVELRFKQRQVADSLTAFYEGNRDYTQSARLRFRERQLSELLGVWQELVSNMARQVELARLDEARDTPAISLIERPYAAPKQVFPRGSIFVLGGALLGLLLGAATLLRETGTRGRLRAFADALD